MDVIRQSSFGEYFCMRARYIFVRSVEEIARDFSSGARSTTRQNATSSRFDGAFIAGALGIVVSKRCGPLIGWRSGSPGWNAKAGSVSIGTSALRSDS